MFVVVEVNECSMFKGVCHQNCINTPRGYRCACSKGYELNDNGISCTGTELLQIIKKKKTRWRHFSSPSSNFNLAVARLKHSVTFFPQILMSAHEVSMAAIIHVVMFPDLTSVRVRKDSDLVMISRRV